ncbi:(Fe-S)-binding protein [Marichromatium bheemlicum]|uniref:Glycolate oxidase iron-sulfur subunit n=1 Tax=Marichromatium bheemlicum TaxID=365339 RepID=A0ABX1I7N5_9GAMM|nr:(Fe-S)-binding protein [Marichromatium bheemlicum]NKN32247.1 (Fe-S)-binding protein [Marichromatium bheemlicum]
MNIVSSPTPPADPAARELLRLADQCVKCGLCLPHCPTYAQTRNEGDSPRGRIALIQGWVSGQLPWDATLAAHLDGCLGCRACERACPSLVAYGRLIDGARSRRQAQRPPWRRWLSRRRLEVVSEAGWVRRLATLVARLRRLGSMPWLDRLAPSRLAPYLRLARVIEPATAASVAPSVATGAEVDLFVGCTQEGLQGGAVVAARALLARLGVRARIAEESLCCGALLRHAGHPEAADRRRERVAEVHAGRTLVGFSSACVGELREHPALAGTAELCAYLDGLAWPETLRLRPAPLRVLVHEPCTHRTLLGGNAAVHRLLGRIPGVVLIGLGEQASCCGAAGIYMLERPGMAQALFADQLAAIRAAAPELIVTTNLGCALQLAASLREAGLEIAVEHPVELLARQLEPLPDT